MSKGIAFRRHQAQKFRRKALTICKRWHIRPTAPEVIERNAQRIAKNRKACSCQMCCNPRRAKWTRGKSKLTMQELRAATGEVR